MHRASRSILLIVVIFSTGCITRLLTVKSEPSGALVYLNDQEIGRTPVTREFQWYGIYDVVLRKQGYQTLKTYAAVSAPLWQYIPLDFFTDMLPVTDHRVVFFTLQPQAREDPAKVLAEGERMRGLLESSGRTKEKLPSTRPKTATTKHASQK